MVKTLVYQYDRFSRCIYNATKYEHKLKNNGVKLISVKENFVDNPAGNMTRNMLMSMAQFYSEDLSMKVRRGQEVSASKFRVITGKVPFGYKNIDKAYVIDEEVAHYAKEIFIRYNDGEKMIDICNYLNNLGLRTSTGNAFTVSSISQILEIKGTRVHILTAEKKRPAQSLP